MCLATSSSPPPSTTTTTQDAGLRKRPTTSSTTSSTRASPPTTHQEKEWSTKEAQVNNSNSNDNMDIVASFENVDCNEIFKFFCKTSVLQDFFDVRKPWVLVPNGSFMGNFDWVPLKFRMGPWHPACAAYLVVLTFWVWHECSSLGYWPAQQQQQPDATTTEAWTTWWYYNVAVFAWSSYIILKIFGSGMGWTSWGMYTVWSWTFTWARHGLCAMTPFRPDYTALSEQLRFPMLVQATLTFAVWNLVIGPSIYAQMKTPATKASFRRFFGNFLWRQMHVYNIAYAALNGIWGSPARSLTKDDFRVALAFCLLYAYFYLIALDRLGVHYYLVFSPRTPFALISWTLLFASYYACFPLWNTILLAASSSTIIDDYA